MRRTLVPLSFSLALVALSAATAAGAVSVQRTDQQAAAGTCRAASTDYASRVRNRPLGVTNISAQNVYLTCALQGDDAQFSTRGATLVVVNASNEEGTAAQALDCTLVNGQVSAGIPFANYSAKTVTIEPGAGSAIQWVPADVPNAGGTIKLPAVSCLLRPGMAINFTTRVYSEDVGA
jgi:hypothetical protein